MYQMTYFEEEYLNIGLGTWWSKKTPGNYEKLMLIAEGQKVIKIQMFFYKLHI